MAIEFLGETEVKIPPEVKEEVTKAHKTHYLFGSRDMSRHFPWRREKNKWENSDWDFAFPYQGSEYQEVKHMLSLGWEEKPLLKYKDDMSFMVWEKTISGHKVQMCSKINLGLFMKVWYRMKPEFYWNYLHKSSPLVLDKEVQKDIFNQLYRTAGWV